MTKKAANSEKTYYVTRKDMPVSCPGPDMEGWNSHPKVYLAFDENGEAVCEYCGAKYIVKAE